VAVFREAVSDVTVWRRFRDVADTFVVLRRDGLIGARAVGNSEAMVELFIELIPEFSSLFALTIDDWRSSRVWRADGVTQNAMLDAFYGLRVPLVNAGGVEFTLEAPHEQLSLSAHLEVVIWSRTERWLYLLQRAGLREQSALRGRLWRPDRGAFAQAPVLTDGVRTMADSLAMQPG
jgi:hypothetical protein